MQKIIVAAALLASFVGTAVAQVTDAEMTCANYLKAEVATPKSGDAAMDKMAADVDKKVHDYCVAHPTAKAMEAAMKALGG